MKKHLLKIALILNFFICRSQTINLNESHLIDFLRTSQLNGDFKSDFSFNIRPIHIGKNGLKINDSIFNLNEFSPKLFTFSNGKGSIKILPIDFNIKGDS